MFDHLKYAGRSDIGCKRTNNEDALGMFPEAGVFCVSDGMGGGDDGEVASVATVKAVEDFCRAYPQRSEKPYSADSFTKGLCVAVNSASTWIYNRAQKNRLKGCGATFVGACFDPANPSEAIALHAGDSRLYRIRGRNIKQITKDHSAAELIGAKNESDMNPMFRGMILRAVGVQPSVEIDLTPLPVRQGDRILICSDGLSKMVEDKDILSISRGNPSPNAAVEALIAAAKSAGGVDNVTVTVIDVGALPKPHSTIRLPSNFFTSKQSSIPDNSDGGDTFDGDTTGSGSPIDSFDGKVDAPTLTTCVPGPFDGQTAGVSTMSMGSGPDSLASMTLTNGSMQQDIDTTSQSPTHGKTRRLALLGVMALALILIGVACVAVFARKDASESSAKMDNPPAELNQAVPSVEDKVKTDKPVADAEARRRAEAEEMAKLLAEERKEADEKRKLAEIARRKAVAEEDAKRKAEEGSRTD